ncbi:SDR family NAD(P)-dependent oxidoreductase [Euzebya tangerina]|uniref:SDR family NAD(P)-dependent oxidoreductase n=1 Tax=Euzebya tangerina TaxID=591198 RepID=UPI000E314AD4|nr:SDR family NAD(P)-dependent oxidoreductase [Euzebya tangerina]
MAELDGRVALVSGSTRGIGQEVARQLIGAGATVYVSGRDPATASQTADALGDGARSLPLPLDVADAGSISAYAAALAAAEAQLDILVNNAAAFVDWTESTSGADLDRSRQVLDVNLYGTWAMIQAFLPQLRSSAHPRIVNVSSGAGSHADPDFGLTARGGAAASYGISKAAINALTSSLAAELAEDDVLVNAVCPGLTATFPGAEQMGARPIEDGARSVVYAATLPDDGPSGGFFRDGEPLGW